MGAGTVIDNSITKNSTLSKKQINSVKAESTNTLTPFLSGFGVDEKEEEHYLIKIIRQLITNKEFLIANKMISYLKETDNFIDLSGEIVKNSNDSELIAKEGYVSSIFFSGYSEL